MGGSKKTTIGYHYRVAYHHGLCKGPIDAFLEFRAADKNAWSGFVTASGRVRIDAPVLFGGEKDQGGVDGDMDLMFGEAGQQPNDYLSSVFGAQQPAWRGLATTVFRGGRYGAMNPYPQKPAYLIRKIKQGWDDPGCWYPDKAQISLLDGQVVLLGSGWEYQIEHFDEPNTVWNNFTVPTSGWLQGGEMPFTTSGMAGGPYWTPTRSNIWLRRKMHINAIGVTLRIGADNGCVVWVNGVNVGSSNPTNAPISANENNPVSYVFGATGTVEVLVKAYAEILASNEGGNIVTLAFSGLPLAGMNPAHILYYSRTNGEMGREPRERIHNASLQAGADWFYAEGFGLCTRYDPASETPVDFEQRICKVAGCSFTRSLADGRWYLDIANGEYDLANLPILTDDDILDFREVPSLLDEAANSISIKYFDVARKESITTAPVIAQGLVAAFGTIHQTLDYPEIPTAALALRVAQRELLARVTPTRAFELTTTRKPWSWRPGQYFRLQCPRRGIADMVCIVGELQSGTTKSGAIRLKAAQDVYSLPATVFVQPEPGVDPSPSQVPVPIATQRVDEVPYIALVAALSRPELQALPDDAGYLAAAAIDPARSRDYTLSVTAAGGAAVDVAFGDWTPSALVVEAAAHLDTDFTLTGGTGLDPITPGMSALWDDEIVRVDAIDPAAGTIRLARGCADTVPAPHAAGSRIWFPDAAVASDPTEYTDGETVTARLLTNTSSQQLAASAATPLPLTFAGRQARPYPPGRLMLNGDAYPAEVGGDVEIAFAVRDRVLQADQLIDTTVGDIGPEPGATVDLEIIDRATSTVVHAEASVSSPVTVPSASVPYLARVALWGVRSGLRSWQALAADFAHGAAPWTPAQLAVPPKVWLDWDSPLTQVSGAASEWGNTNGALGGAFAQTTAASRPLIVADGLNGKRVLRFDGSNDRLLASSPILAALNNVPAAWLIVVARKPSADASSTSRRIVAFEVGGTSGTVRAALYWDDSLAGANRIALGGRRLDAEAYQSVASTAPSYGDWRLIVGEVNYTARTLTLALDGAIDSVTSGAWTGGGNTSATNSRLADVGTNFGGDIACVLAGSSVLSTEDRQRLEGWAAWECGLVASLPANHPYKRRRPTVEPPPPWTPAALPVPPKVWLDWDSPITEVSGTASQWSDRSSNGWHFTQSTAANRPAILAAGLSGRRVLSFDGTNDFLANTSADARNVMRAVNAGWCFAVYRKRTTDGGVTSRAVVGMPNGGSSGSRFALSAPDATPRATARRLDAEATAAYVSGVQSTDWVMVLAVADFAGATLALHLDGNLDGTAAMASAGATSNTAATFGLTVGTYTRSTASGEVIDADIAAVLVGAGTVPTSDEIDKLFGWAAWECGLSDHLPADHPYRYVRPAMDD